MIFKTILALITLGLFSLSHAQQGPTFLEGEDPKPEGKSWVPVPEMTDEFNGSSIDESKWQTEPYGNGWMWVGRPPGLFQARNVTVKNGNMNVEVGKLEKPMTVRKHDYTYYGAIVRSHHPGQVGWYYETRMKANATEMSSTFWLMTKGRGKKKLELDIQECVGRVSPRAASWAKDWDQVFHSNMIHRVNKYNPEKVQRSGKVATETKNHERYYVYGAWWKSPHEVRFYLDGKYVYSIKPNIEWDVPAFYQMAIETYDWNPVPEGGGLVASGTKEQRTTKYDWVRTWKLQ